MADCHPDLPHHGRGFCWRCYTEEVIKKRPPQPKDPPAEDVGTFDKQDCINLIAYAAGLTPQKAKEAFDAVFIAITAALCSGETVHVRGLGTFYFRKRTPTRRPVTFKPCRRIKHHLSPTNARIAKVINEHPVTS